MVAEKKWLIYFDCCPMNEAPLSVDQIIIISIQLALAVVPSECGRGCD